MNKALRLFFWGYLFIFFRIHIGWDWLPDPIGYVFIYLGCAHFLDNTPYAKKARLFSAIGIIITIPAAFVNLSQVQHGKWEIYTVLLLVLKIIVAYYLFFILKSSVQDFPNQSIHKRIVVTFRNYVAIHFSVLTFLSFSMNVPASESFWITVGFILTFGALIMEIAFLLLMRSIRRNVPKKPSFVS